MSAETARAKFNGRRPMLALLSLVAVVLAGVAGFRGLGRWLVREDPLGRADAIVVLSGGLPYRAEEAAWIYRGGYAPQVWLTRPASSARQLARLGISFIGEEQYDREVLVHSGVDAAAVHILPDEIADTEQELRGVARELHDTHLSTVIIVTSPEHTRRVRALWALLGEPGEKAIVRAARGDPFDRDHWWRNTRDAYAVLRELLGLANAWMGLRIRPARSAWSPTPLSRGASEGANRLAPGAGCMRITSAFWFSTERG
jgi:uncharacterized SAM-binding protein YcdF (DUF218 family)